MNTSRIAKQLSIAVYQSFSRANFLCSSHHVSSEGNPSGGKRVHLLALLVQQGQESSRLLADQLNAAAVVSVADGLPGDALCHIIFLW